MFLTKRRWQRFAREIEIWRNLSHPNIIKLHGWLKEGPLNSQPCVVMDYADKGDLDAYLLSMKQPRSSTLGERLDIVSYASFTLGSHHSRGAIYDVRKLIQVAEALVYLHSHTLVHSDVQPRNVLIMASAPKVKVVLSDFGAARIAEMPKQQVQTTSQNVSPPAGYKAAETYPGKGDQFTRLPSSDVYSFGSLIVKVSRFRPCIFSRRFLT